LGIEISDETSQRSTTDTLSNKSLMYLPHQI